MRTHSRASRSFPSSALLAALASTGTLLGLAGCGGSESASPGTNEPINRDFVVDGVNVVNGAVWKLNRPIDIIFNGAVDFSTVNSNTIQITDTTGIPALGTYTLIAPDTVRFQPLCPTNSTYTNGGLQQNRVYYLVIVGSDTSVVTVRDTAGNPVETGITVAFQTPSSNDPVNLFVDQVAGPPAVLIRGLGGVPLDSTDVTYVEFGGDPGSREYVRLNPITQQGELFPFGSILVPLNLYSRVEEQFSVVLQFNQPVNASAENVSSNRIRFEYRNAASGLWLPLPSQVVLLDNCTAIGSSVRVTPQGLVPQGADLRINVRDGFEDLTGDAVQADLTSFVRVTSETVDTPGTADPTEGADEIFEAFTFGGGGLNSGEDTLADSTKPRASWGEGVVQPSFAFGGTGGPQGTFDWVVRAGQTVLIDTAADQIRGGPGGVETTVQTVINGVIDVRNMTVETGGTLLFAGPNTVTILASGTVTINGLVSANGGDNPGVKTLNTTNQPEPGASGGPGGGTGGTGSFLTAQSTPRGGPGAGAFERQSFGGGGGETSFAPSSLDQRRGAGGGGGRFGKDTRYIAPGGEFVRCQTLIGFDAEPGFPGGAGGTGAVSQTTRAQGGVMGPFPFFDQTDENDFLGIMRTAPVLVGGQVTEPSRIIIGELTKVWAGAGGGAGGDAVTGNQFPITPFNISGDEKASGGGGGAGGIQILTIGEIRIGANGRLSCDGGYGGAGENTYLFDRVGGGGGGGSGGHIVLSSANRIVVEAEVDEGAAFNQALPFYTDPTAQLRHPKRPVTALGGQGGAGKDDRCGANAQGERDWKVDAIPQSAFEGLMTIPPWGNTTGNNSFLQCNTGSPTDPIGTVPGGGGDGGPGIIQFHATNLDTQILFPNRPGLYGSTGVDVTFSCSPPPLGWERPTVAPDQMIPFFGDESEATSKWIALGQARRNPNGSTNLLTFSFGGTDLTSPTPSEQGIVLRDGTTVDDLDPVIDYAGIVNGQTTVPFIVGGDRVTLDASGLDDLYKKNTALVRNFTLRLRDATAPTEYFDYVVLDAEFVVALDHLVVTVDPQGTNLVDTVLLLSPNGEIGLIPNFFQVISAGVPNNYPFNTSVRITFDATTVDEATGLPDEDARYSTTQNAGNLTPDITDLNANNWDFVRFRVEFDLDADGTSGIDLSAPRPALDYLRMPFRF
jgi:hypothetical protein